MIVKSTINETVQNIKVKGNKANKASDFIITINSNKSVTCCRGELKEKLPKIYEVFKELINNLFNEKNLPKLIVKTQKIDGKVERFPITENDVISIKAKTVFEISKQGTGSLHSHTYVRIIRKVPVQINISMIKNISYKVLEPYLTFNGKFEKPYINVKGVNSTSFNFERYVSADPEFIN